jgi:hypothetical protein
MIHLCHSGTSPAPGVSIPSNHALTESIRWRARLLTRPALPRDLLSFPEEARIQTELDRPGRVRGVVIKLVAEDLALFRCGIKRGHDSWKSVPIDSVVKPVNLMRPGAWSLRALRLQRSWLVPSCV